MTNGGISMKRSTYTLRRLLALVLVLVMVGSLFAGCNKKTNDPTVPSEPNETIAPTAEPTEEPTVAPTDEPTEAPTEPAETVPPVLMGTVNADNLNVRSEPYSTADILKRLAINTRIEILEQKIVDGVNWGRIAEGWINLNYVTIGVEFPESNNDSSNVVNNENAIGSGGIATNNSTDGVVTTGLNIRKSADAESAAVGSYSKGDKVTILERSGNWGRTNKGWINLKYVDFTGTVSANTSSGSSSSSSGTNSTTVSNGNVVILGYGTVVKTTSLAIRSGPGANYTQVSYIRMGEEHPYYQVSTNGWVRLKKGWVNADYLDLEYAVESGTEATVTASELSVREEADYNSSKLYTYEKGDEIIILEVDGTWGMVEYTTGQYGWVDLDKVKLPTPVASNYSTGVATVTADALHIRKKASASADSLGALEKGDKVDIIEVNGNWGKFEMDNGDYGWINLKYTKMTSTYSTGTGYITASKLNVRELPDEDSDSLDKLSKGDKVIILDTEGTWGKIEYEKGEYGWISLKYVTMTSTSTGTTPSSSTKYTVTINRPDYGTVTTSASSYVKGATVTLKATPASGYQLAGLHVVAANGTVIPVSGTSFTMPDSNVTVSATFVEGADNKIYTVTCGSNVSATPTGLIAQGTKVALTISAPANKTLSTLSIKDSNGNSISYGTDYTFTMPASNVTVAVTFVDSSAAVYNIDTAGAPNVTSNYTKAAKGPTVTLTASPAAGYELSSIVVMANGQPVTVTGSGNTRTFVMPEYEVTVTATYTAKQYSVSVSSVTGGSASVNPSACAVDSYVTVTATPATDYALQNIKVYGPNNEVVATLTSSGDTFKMPAYNVTVVPSFTKSVYDITGISCNISGATVTPSATQSQSGKTITLTTAYADTRFVVKSVVVKAGSTNITVSGSGNTYTFTMPAAKVDNIIVTYARQYVVKESLATLRKEASATSEDLGTIPAGTAFFAMDGSTSEWIKVTYNDQIGWVYHDALN